MALTGYSSSGTNPRHAYQQAWSVMVPDATVCDGNTATGPEGSPDSPPVEWTAGVDAGSSVMISGIVFTVGFENVLTYILEWSNDSTTWSTAGISLPSPPNHSGTFSLYTVTLTGLSINARYLRLSVSDDGSTSFSGHASIREISITAITPYDCFEPTEILPLAWSSAASLQKITFALGSASTGKWWGGTLELKFTINSAFTSAQINSTYHVYLEACVLRADNGSNDGAFNLTSGHGLRFQLTAGATSFDLTTTLTDQFLDACTSASGGNLVVTLYSNWNPPFKTITLTEADLCLRNHADTSAGGSDGGAVPTEPVCHPLCGSNTTTGASGSFSSANLNGVKYQVIGGVVVDALTLISSYVNSSASAATYESDGILRHIDVTIPVPATTMPYDWLDCKLTLKGTYAPDHDFGQLETTDDYPMYEFIIGCDLHDHGGGSFSLDQIARSDIYDGRYASDFSVTGISMYLCPGSGPIKGSPFGVSMNENLGNSYRLYIVARQVSTDGSHSGDSLIDWGSFTFTTADFLFHECNVGAGGTYDATKTADPGPVFSDPSPLPIDSIGGFHAHLNATTVYKKAANPDISTTYDRWLSAPIPSTTYPNYHWYHENTNVSDSNGQVADYVFNPHSSGYVLDSFTINSFSETYCKCDALDANSVFVQAETFNGILNVLWVSGGPPGKLKFATHLAPAKHIGASTVGWLSTQEIESTNDVTNCGMVYLPNGRLYINYNYTGASKQRYNDRFGTGTASDWSARAAADSDHISAGGTGQQQAWRFEVGGAGIPGIIYFAQCRDNAGAAWTTAVEATGNIARGPLSGGAFTGNQYLLLYTRGTDGNIFFLSTADPATWTGDGTDTGFAGNVCGLAQHPSGRLVGLVQASPGGAVKCMISNDRGATWSGTANLGITPTPPPVIVCDEAGTLYAAYIDSDAPHFMASLDGGEVWA